MRAGEALYVLPSLRAGAGDEGGIVLTRKFIEGAAAYAERWPGPVVVCMRRRTGADTNLDHVEVDPADLPFGFQWLEDDAAGVARQIGGARLVLASLIDHHVRMATICARCAVPLVYVSEYCLQTRRQIIRAETANPLLRWRRQWWTMRIERQFEQALRLAAGVQCNGTPVHDAYQNVNPSALLYFDSRVRRDMLATPEVLEQRTRELLDGRPLRLAFSGRLIRMKGADHLLPVAAGLKRLGVPFTMDICGGGPLLDTLKLRILRLGLADRVRLRGVLDFRRELMPFITRHVDLFVCCHRQGDPSCTYLETMACGTPIAGYDNGAARGIVKHSTVGWLSALDRPRELAQRIARLDDDRSHLADAAETALAFARRHTFEETMQRRVDHMIECSDRQKLSAAS
ncbi:MAG: glycosyltransferase [Planctomycetota bacterium]|nr:glycosyltransferase [Planctomycetota bacterium]